MKTYEFGYTQLVEDKAQDFVVAWIGALSVPGYLANANENNKKEIEGYFHAGSYPIVWWVREQATEACQDNGD